MTVTATYLADLSRVRVAYSGFSTNADYAVVERSSDGITWTLVRGGDKAPMSAGSGHLDDYEFDAGVENFYRVSAVDTGPIEMVPAAGAAATSNNAAVTPALPTGWREGDLLLLVAGALHTGFTPTLVPPAGWTRISQFGDYIFFGRRATATETAPTVAVTGGATGMGVVAQVTAFHNADLLPTSSQNAGGSGQNITLPALINPPPATLNLWVGKKDSAWTSVTDPGNFGVIGSNTATGVGVWWGYTVQAPTTGTTILTRTLTIAGGAAAANVGFTYVFQKAPYLTRQTGSITPVITQPWLKNPSRPSLNFPIEIVSNSSITRASRTGVFPVKGRTLPVSVADKQSSRQFTIGIDLSGYSSIRDIDTRLASGEPWFFQQPDSNGFLPTCYITMGDIELAQDATNSDSMTYTIPMTEVAKPGVTVYGDTYIWADVIEDYSTWADVVAAVPDWSGLVDKIGDAEVIVP